MIVDIIKNFIDLSKKGNSYVGICPFHDDKRPSLYVSESKNCYNCFVCQAKGNELTFISKFKNCSLNESKIIANEILGTSKYLPNGNYDVKRQEQINNLIIISELSKSFLLSHETGKVGLEYLLNRKISLETISKFEIGFAPNDKRMFINLLQHSNNFSTPFEKISPIKLEELGFRNIISDGTGVAAFQNRVLFPVKNGKNELVAFSSRTVDESVEPKYMNSITLKKDVLYGLNYLNPNLDNLYICEGLLDTLTLSQLGYNAVCTFGVNLSSEQFDILTKLKNLKQVFVMFDNDKAGYEATINVFKNIRLKNKRLIVNFPDYYQIEAKDINELYCKQPEIVKTLCCNCIDLNLFKTNYYLKTLDSTKLNSWNIMSNDINIEKSIFKNLIIDRLYKNGYESVAACHDDKKIFDFLNQNQDKLDNDFKNKLVKEFGDNFINKR